MVEWQIEGKNILKSHSRLFELKKEPLFNSGKILKKKQDSANNELKWKDDVFVKPKEGVFQYQREAVLSFLSISDGLYLKDGMF